MKKSFRSNISQILGYITLLLLSALFTACSVAKKPSRIIQLPPELAEASGLTIENTANFYLHNDSGDGPIFYQFNPITKAVEATPIPARANDWEDMTSDDQGHLYFADVGNNRGQRVQQTIYRYHPSTKQTDSIIFTYPLQDGQGRLQPGNYDCEAIVYFNHELHLFTKAIPGKRKSYWSYHFQVPSVPGLYEATLIDSLYFPRRTITAAALNPTGDQLVLTSYNYKRFLGFFPVSASSLITITDYPDNAFFQGKVRRRNLSWAIATQYESVDFYDDKYLYIATERTIMKQQSLRRVKRKKQ